jgi:hypothetical protein
VSLQLLEHATAALAVMPAGKIRPFDICRKTLQINPDTLCETIIQRERPEEFRVFNRNTEKRDEYIDQLAPMHGARVNACLVLPWCFDTY